MIDEVLVPGEFREKSRRTSQWMNSSQMSNSNVTTSIADSLPNCTAISRNQPNRNCPPLCFDDFDTPEARASVVTEPVLVPIRLDLEIEGQKLRDYFVWNKKENLITPETFAEITCADLELNPLNFIPAITHSIKQQLESFPSEKPETENSCNNVIIRLNIHVGNVNLTDQFLWDANNPDNNPEEFASILAADLGLGGEFVTSIAFSIRSQLLWHRQGNPASSSASFDITCPIRNSEILNEWSPSVELMSDADMERKLRDEDRNARRMRRMYNP
ncbi:hypothetical protein GJ496_009893 [Pomphorhynchus laevis]|nr:hypothetical protein GJ496_009893 [Pomphorhynchus laevis]